MQSLEKSVIVLCTMLFVKVQPLASYFADIASIVQKRGIIPLALDDTGRPEVRILLALGCTGRIGVGNLFLLLMTLADYDWGTFLLEVEILPPFVEHLLLYSGCLNIAQVLPKATAMLS